MVEDIDPSLMAACFSALWQDAPDNMFLLRAEQGDFSIAALNPAHLDVVAMAQPFYPGIPLREAVPLGFYQRIAANYQRCLAAGHPIRYEEPYVNPDGEYSCWETRLIPLAGQNGLGWHILGVGRNITAIREAEVAAERSRQGEAYANHVKSAFLANMSHEMRTPLNGIMGATSLLIESQDRDEQQALAGLIQQSVNDLARLTENTLDYARLNMGEVRLELCSFSLDALLRALMEELRPQAEAKGLFFLYQPTALPSGNVRGDANRIQQLVWQLLHNAIRFCDSGGVILSLDTQYADDGLVHCRVAVTDTGIGLDDSMRQRLFQPFSQLDNSSTRKVQGAGLGLAICKQLSDLMGGNIMLNSSPGQGSCFEWHCTLQPAPLQAPLAKAPAPLSGTLRGAVLVVEDNPVNSLVLERLLRKEGLQVICAHNGAQGVAAFAQQPVDLVLMDWHMPEMDGLEATRRIRALGDAGARVPILGLTANVLPEQLALCRQAGMSDVLTKPIARDRLRHVLGKWLSTG